MKGDPRSLRRATVAAPERSPPDDPVARQHTGQGRLLWIAHATRGVFRRFPVVELQQTFYQPPRLKTVQRWREEVPATFEFTMKAWQLITHEPGSPTYRRLKIAILQAKAGGTGPSSRPKRSGGPGSGPRRSPLASKPPSSPDSG
ncbi:MAG: DUF72 domain-containing protein [Candidatus Methylomirabilales bacterium]